MPMLAMARLLDACTKVLNGRAVKSITSLISKRHRQQAVCAARCGSERSIIGEGRDAI